MVLFLVLLYVWRRLRKMDIFKKGRKCLNWAPQHFVGPPLGPNFKVLGIIWCCRPLRLHISKFSDLYDVGTLNLYLRMPDTMQRESALSDHPARRKRPKCGPIVLFQIYPNIYEHFGRFLWTGWLDQADSFCIVPGVPRHKFRVPTSYKSENFEMWSLSGRQHSGGPSWGTFPLFWKFPFFAIFFNI
jgi:hypothetical protein